MTAKHFTQRSSLAMLAAALAAGTTIVACGPTDEPTEFENFEGEIAVVSCSGIPAWTSGTTQTVVQNKGNKYTCKVPGWCSNAGASSAYEPGAGWAWQEAWTLDAQCGSGGSGTGGSGSGSGGSTGSGARGGTGGTSGTSGSGGTGGGSLPGGSSDWMHTRYGIGFHYLQDWLNETKNGGPDEWNRTVNSFDVNRFANDAAATGAKWVLFTLGQNSGYYIAPNATINRYSGYKPGERCANRDLAMDLGKALAAKGIKLILYLPSNAPAHDAKIANGFGLTQNTGNWVPNEAFTKKWAEVIREWSTRYKTYVAGWWFDGFYGSFKPAWGKNYQDAAKAGNPNALVALNRGLSFFVRASPYQDYIAGETKDIDARTCAARLHEGVQCHIFTPFGGWAGGRVKYTDDKILDYTQDQIRVGAAITWNLGVNGAGVITADHVNVFKRIGAKTGARP